MGKYTSKWTKSPITGRDMVLQEFEEDNGVCKMDLSSGFYSNEYTCNYKKHGFETIEKLESTMPAAILHLRLDDGESYWYPSVIQTKEEIVFPSGATYSTITWHHAKMIDTKMDESTITNYDSYLEASKEISGHFLGDI